MIQYDYKTAIQSYTPEAIAEYLSGRVGIDYQQVRGMGYSPTEILENLASQGAVKLIGFGEPVQAEMGDVKRGLMQGIQTSQAGAYGAVGLAGSIAEKAGAKDLGKKVKDWGFEGYQRNMDEASKYPTKQFSDVHSTGDFVDYIQGLAASQIPVMAEVVIGSALSGGVGYAAAKTAISKTAKEMAKSAIEKQVKAGVLKEAAKETAETALEKSLVKGFMKQKAGDLSRKAAKAGMVGTVAQLESGLNYGEVLDKHGIDAPVSALGFGALAASFEAMGGNIGLINDFIGGVSKKLPGAYIKRAAKRILINTPAEALQEAGQEVTSILNTVVNTDEKLLTPDNMKQIFESGVAGGIMGTGGGMVQGIMRKEGQDPDLDAGPKSRDALYGRLSDVSKTTEEKMSEVKNSADVRKDVVDQYKKRQSENIITEAQRPRGADADDDKGGQAGVDESDQTRRTALTSSISNIGEKRRRLEDSIKDAQIDKFERDLKQAQDEIQDYTTPEVTPELTPDAVEIIARQEKAAQQEEVDRINQGLDENSDDPFLKGEDDTTQNQQAAPAQPSEVAQEQVVETGLVKGQIRKVVNDRINEKYSDIIDLPESDARHDIYDGIINGRIFPENLDNYLKKSENKESDIQDVKAAIADRLGDLKETYRYEGFEQEKEIEDYIDSLLAVTRAHEVSGKPLQDKNTPTPTRAKIGAVSDDPGIIQQNNTPSASDTSAPQGVASITQSQPNVDRSIKQSAIETTLQPNQPVTWKTKSGKTLSGTLLKKNGKYWSVQKGDSKKTLVAADKLKADNPDVSFQTASGFYSTLEKGVKNLKQEKAPALQWMGMIKKIPGLKQEEMEWVGLNDWLKEQKGKVNKQDIVDFVRANNVQVEEASKAQRYTFFDSTKQEHFYGPEAEADREREAAINWIADESVYIDDESDDNVTVYNYEGDVIWFANKNEDGDWVDGDYNDVISDLKEDVLEIAEKRAARERDFYFDELTDVDIDEDFDSSTRYHDYILPGGKNYKELLLTMPEDGDSYKSSHWDEPNVLAHVRFSEREVDGRRVLHIEEIQSDWHQEGRKKGYRDQGYINELKNEKKEIEDSYSEGETWSTGDRLRWSDITTAIRELNSDDKTPNAPFKKSWPTLAFKRMVRYAAENGFDTIAWTPGELQAERYNLSKQVDEIGWSSGGNDKYVTFKGLTGASNQDLEVVLDKKTSKVKVADMGAPSDWTGKHLSDLVGKEVSEKIINQDKGRLSGDGLKVGGSGMKGFYDKILPAEVKKLFGKKAWGKPRMGQMKIDAGGPVKLHALEITPKMKEKALGEGLPLFQSKAKDAKLSQKENTNGRTLVGKRAASTDKKQPGKTISRKDAEKQFHRLFGRKDPNGTTQLVHTIAKADRQLQKIGQLFGQQVFFYKSQDEKLRQANGFTNKAERVIFLNKEADQPLLTVLGHELIHQLESNHKDLYDFLLSTIRVSDKNFEIYVKNLVRQRENLDFAKLSEAHKEKFYEEFIGDFASDQFHKAEFWQKLIDENRTMTEQIIDILRSMLEKIRSMFPRAEQFVFNLRESQDALAYAMSEAINRSGGLKSEANNDNRYSATKTPGKGDISTGSNPVTPDGGISLFDSQDDLVKDILSHIDDDSWYDYGLRVVPPEAEYTPKIGDIQPESNRWEDGEDLGESLGGTSTIGIQNRDVMQALVDLGVSDGRGPNGYYFGDTVVLLRGSGVEVGEDVGEVVISDAEVVAIYKKASDGNSQIIGKVSPNPPSAPEQGAQSRQSSKTDISYQTNAPSLSVDADRIYEEDESNFFQKGIDLLTGSIQYRKEKPKGDRKDVSALAHVLKSTMYNAEKIGGAYKRLFNTLRRRDDYKYEKQNELWYEGDDSILEGLKRVAKHKVDYTRLKNYLVSRDIEAKGFIVQEKDGEYHLLHWKRENGKRKPIGVYQSEDEAWQDAILIEAEESGLSENARDGLIRFRKMSHNLYHHFAADIEKIIQDHEEAGEPLPQIVVQTKDGRTQVDLKVAAAMMGDRRGYYFPRQRKSGQYKVVMSKPGKADQLQFFDTKIGAMGYRKTWEGKGYKVSEFEKVGKLSEDLFQSLESLLSQEGVFNKALDQIGNKDRHRNLEDINITAEWRGKDLVLNGRGLGANEEDLLKPLGGEYRDRFEGNRYKPEVVFKDVPANKVEWLEDKITKTLLRSNAMFPDMDLEFSKALATQYDTILKGRGARARMIGRTDAKGIDVKQGYETDPIIAITQAMQAAAGSYAKSRVAKEGIEAITGRDISWNDFQSKDERSETIQSLEAELDDLNISSPGQNERKAELRKELQAVRRELENMEFVEADQIIEKQKQIKSILKELKAITKWSDIDKAKKIQARINDAKTGMFESYLEEVKKRRLDAAKQPTAHKEATAALKDIVRNEEAADRLIGTLKGLTVWQYLGFRVSSAAVNMTNLVTGVPAVMNGETKNGVSITSALKHVGVGLKDFGLHRSGKLTGEKKRVYDEIREKGWDAPIFNREAFDVLQGRLGRGWSRALEYSMYIFGKTEEMNRASTIAGAYFAMKKANKGKWDHDAMMEKAKDISDKAHGVYGKENRFYHSRGDNIGARVLQMSYVFQTFTHNYLQEMHRLGMDKRQHKAALYMALSPAMFGIGSTVPIGVAKAISNALGGDDPEEKLIQLAEDNFGMGRFARYGITGIGDHGVSMKGSLATRFGTPNSFWDIFGAPGSVVSDWWEGGKNITKGYWQEGFEKIAPAALGNISKGLREMSDGVTTRTGSPVYFGKEQIKGDVLDTVLRVLSFNPTRIAEKKDIRWYETRTRQRYQEKKSDLYKRIRRFYSTPPASRSRADLVNIWADIRDFNQEIKKVGITRYVPIITKETIKSNLRRSMRPGKSERLRRVGG